MASTPLTDKDWKRLVAAYIVPAFGHQLETEKFDPHADWVGCKLIADKWSVTRTEWCLREVTRYYRQLDNLYAMVNHVDAGQRDRDGNVIGGWLQSKEHRAENMAVQYARDRNDCYARCRDFPHKEPGCTRRKEYCGDCPGIQRRTSAQTGGELKPLLELLQQGSKR